jgi:hypothetical protein
MSLSTEMERAIARYVEHDDQSIDRVAEQCGVNKHMLRCHITRRGLLVPHDPKRRKRRYVPPPIETLSPKRRHLHAVADYSVAHPAETLRSVAEKFGVSLSALKSHLLRSGKAGAVARRTKLHTEQVVLARSGHPTENCVELAERLGLPVETVRRVLRERFGTSRAEPAAALLRCRICGETDPGKFNRSSKYRSGYQDKCKACAYHWYITKGDGKHRQRAGRPRRTFRRIMVAEAEFQDAQEKLILRPVGAGGSECET